MLLAHLFVWHPNSFPLKKHQKPEQPKGFYGMLDMRRKAQICSAQAADYSDALVLVPDHQFDLDYTIFANVKGVVARYIMKKKLALKMYWHDKFIGPAAAVCNAVWT